MGGREIVFPKVLCEGCAAAQESEMRKEREEQQRSQRLRRWHELCPSVYRESDPARLPRASLEHVWAWRENQEGRGLLLVGPPRVGKTRCVWLLLRHLFVEEAVPVIALSDTEFAHQCGQQFAKHTGHEWIQRLCMTRLLFLDDLGKAAATERYRRELYHVIEQRTAWRRPLLVTTNDNGQELAKRLGDTMGMALVARLREFCDVVPFEPPDDFQSSNRKKIP